MADDNEENSEFDRLAHDLSQLSELAEEGIMTHFEEILALVAYDKIRGVDISKAHPVFYEQLNHSRVLRSAFEDALSIIEESERPSVTAQAVELKSTILEQVNDRWQQTWMVVKQNLEDLFNPHSYQLGRAVRGESEENTVIKEVAEVENLELEIWLKILPVNEAFELNPQLIVHDIHGRQLSFSLEATLYWGDYKQTVAIPPSGMVTLPAIPAESVFDESTESAYDLKFELRQI